MADETLVLDETQTADATEVTEVKTSGTVRARIDLAAMAFSGADLAKVREGVANGDIVADDEAKVTIRAGSGSNKSKFAEVQPVIAYYAVTPLGCLILSKGKAEGMTPRGVGKDERTEYQKQKGVIDHYNYGFDLDLRRPVREKLDDSLAGPEKAIAKMAKVMVEGGYMDSLEEATLAIIARLRAKGEAIPAGY